MLQNGGLAWIPKLNMYSKQGIIDIFKEIIGEQEWNLTNEINADGDSGDWIKYSNGIITKRSIYR